MQHRIKVHTDHEALSRAAAEFIQTSALAAIATRGRFILCLSGGNTPKAAYRWLSQSPFRDSIPWKQVHVFWGDERCIPLDDPQNHYRMATETFLSKVAIPNENIHRMRGESPDPHAAAREYEATLSEFFCLRPGAKPDFDLIILGLGTDGHTASLYPGTAGLLEKTRLTVAHYVPQREGYRLTLTLPVINAARSALFLVSGPEKAWAVQAVLANENSPKPLPSQLVRRCSGAITWLIDRAAAGELVLRPNLPSSVFLI